MNSFSRSLPGRGLLLLVFFLLAPATGFAAESSKPATEKKGGAAAGAKKKGAASEAPLGQARDESKPNFKKGTANRQALLEYCGQVVKCGLKAPPGFCPDSLSKGLPGVKYDRDRCLEARVMNSRGVTPVDPEVGFKLYRFLGQEYRIIYLIEDKVKISEPRLAYLLDDLPLSAKLISHFQKTPYSAEYLDAERRHFKGTRGKNLKGDARLVSGSSGERRLYYFGYGIAEVAWWRLRGPAFLEFEYQVDPKNPQEIRYKMRILVFPGNGFVNGIMNLGLFKKIVFSKIREVLDDITASAQKLASGGQGSLQKAPLFTAEDKAKVEAFLKLP